VSPRAAKLVYRAPMRRRAKTFLWCGIFGASLALACSKREPSPAPAASASAALGEGDAGADADRDDEVRPLYPADDAPADPLAARLCAALHDLPETRRSSCCNEKPAVVVAKECTRTLSSALRSKAAKLAAPDVDACAAALAKSLEGCDWVGPFPPELPAECLGVIHGTLPAGAVCRSSLECDGALRCRGLGPTSPGKCGGPTGDGASCGSTVDTLATYTRQVDVDRSHPECEHFCNRHECTPLVSEGGACVTSAQCGPSHQCIKQKCVSAPPSKRGEACPGQVCEAGTSCIAGKCQARKAGGEVCSTDFECVGGCIRPDGGAKGKCGQKCSIR